LLFAYQKWYEQEKNATSRGLSAMDSTYENIKFPFALSLSKGGVCFDKLSIYAPEGTNG
jgi:hypothetical protein